MWGCFLSFRCSVKTNKKKQEWILQTKAFNSRQSSVSYESSSAQMSVILHLETAIQLFKPNIIRYAHVFKQTVP